jgi:diguanylate cyclase (GGDEF)-like protein
MLIIMYAIFILTAFAAILKLKNKLSRKYDLAAGDFSAVNDNLKELEVEEKRLNIENEQREGSVLKIMNIYEVTKEICEFLGEDKIFENFKSGLSQFVSLQGCEYMDTPKPQGEAKELEIFPLTSDSENYGYLAIKGLKKEDRQIFDILVIQFVTSIKRARLYERVQSLAITDSLTKVYTRRYSLDRFEEELKRSQEFNLSLSFLMIDIDNFKSFNDKYGHLVGDVILKAVSEVIKVNCREIDLIGRFGGEEFMVIMPMTSKDGALFAAERIRKSLESNPVKAFDETLKVTLSAGVASFAQDAQTCQELIDKADWALYRSKRTGKNRVSAFARYE